MNAQILLSVLNISEKDVVAYLQEHSTGDKSEPVYFFFAAVAAAIPCHKILEIGTGTGTLTKLLADLFTNAQVYSVDLPGDLNYRRIRNPERFVENTKNERIHLLTMDSFFLMKHLRDDQFDFAWIDGGHEYPTIAWDVAFAYNSLTPGGILAMHDCENKKFNVMQAIEYVKKIVPEPFRTFPCRHGICWLRKDPK